MRTGSSRSLLVWYERRQPSSRRQAPRARFQFPRSAVDQALGQYARRRQWHAGHASSILAPLMPSVRGRGHLEGSSPRRPTGSRLGVKRWPARPHGADGRRPTLENSSNGPIASWKSAGLQHGLRGPPAVAPFAAWIWRSAKGGSRGHGARTENPRGCSRSRTLLLVCSFMVRPARFERATFRSGGSSEVFSLR